MSVRILLLCACLIISACTPIQVNHRTNPRARAIEAAARSDWEAAYRFSEDDLLLGNSESREKARQFVLKNPLIYAAAGRTFQISALQESTQRYGKNAAYSVEKNRLQAYKLVATTEDYAKASNNLTAIFNDIEKKKADSNLKTEELIQLESAARVLCRNEVECKKIFALTEIFFSENSDMKIQIATPNIIETYNPTRSSNIGLKAFKIPGRGESAEVAIRVVCSADASAEYCENRKSDLYKAFPEFIKARLLE